MITHFVSKTCAGERCACGRPAAHKLGEEIPHDEPCVACGESWRRTSQTQVDWDLRGKTCGEVIHVTGSPQRHNLAAYVCCACFVRVVGAAAGCVLSARETEAIELLQYARVPDSEATPFDPASPVICLRCSDRLCATGPNTTGTLEYLECRGCGAAYVAPIRKESAHAGTGVA